MLNRPKMHLKTFQAIDPAVVFKPPEPKPEPPVLVPKPEKTEPPPEPAAKRYEPTAVWAEIPTNRQFLRIVLDDRVNVGKRIYRIELWDKERKERIAVFRRQTEAHRR